MKFILVLGIVLIAGCGGGGGVDATEKQSQPLAWDSGNWDKDKWQ